MLEQLKHGHNSYRSWVSIIPMVVGIRGAVNVEVIDFPGQREQSEIAFEAWERMTYGGVQVEYAPLPYWVRKYGDPGLSSHVDEGVWEVYSLVTG